MFLNLNCKCGENVKEKSLIDKENVLIVNLMFSTVRLW